VKLDKHLYPIVFLSSFFIQRRCAKKGKKKYIL